MISRQASFPDNSKGFARHSGHSHDVLLAMIERLFELTEIRMEQDFVQGTLQQISHKARVRLVEVRNIPRRLRDDPADLGPIHLLQRGAEASHLLLRRVLPQGGLHPDHDFEG